MIGADDSIHADDPPASTKKRNMTKCYALHSRIACRSFKKQCSLPLQLNTYVTESWVQSASGKDRHAAIQANDYRLSASSTSSNTFGRYPVQEKTFECHCFSCMHTCTDSTSALSLSGWVMASLCSHTLSARLPAWSNQSCMPCWCLSSYRSTFTLVMYYHDQLNPGHGLLVLLAVSAWEIV